MRKAWYLIAALALALAVPAGLALGDPVQGRPAPSGLEVTVAPTSTGPWGDPTPTHGPIVTAEPSAPHNTAGPIPWPSRTWGTRG